MDLTKMFDGRKTYLAAAALAVMAFLRFRAGDQSGAAELLAQALGLFGLRSALSAVPPSPPGPPAAPVV